MFSQVCAKNSVHRWRGLHPSSGQPPPPADIPLNPGRHPRAEIPLDRHPPWQTPPRQTHPHTATAVHGTCPTGMHYCFSNYVIMLPPLGIEPGTLELWELLWVHYHAFLNELT